MLRKWLLSKLIEQLDRLPRKYSLSIGILLTCVMTITGFISLDNNAPAINSYEMTAELKPLHLKSNNHSSVEIPSDSRQEWITAYAQRIPHWDMLSTAQKDQLLQESMNLGAP